MDLLDFWHYLLSMLFNHLQKDSTFLAWSNFMTSHKIFVELPKKKCEDGNYSCIPLKSFINSFNLFDDEKSGATWGWVCWVVFINGKHFTQLIRRKTIYIFIKIMHKRPQEQS